VTGAAMRGTPAFNLLDGMNRYKARGVSAQKEDVHAAIASGDLGLFPTAFCKIVPDSLTGDPEWCIAMHADGAGSKSALAYLYYRETGDPAVFGGIAQDALVMNLDDLLCVGATGPFLLSNTIARNARRVPGEVLSGILAGYEALVRQFAEWGISVVPAGGETADLGDLVGTLVVDATLATRMRRVDVVANDRIKPGDLIIGLASHGQTTYEAAYNAGMGSNGLTSARHDLLRKEYAMRYPETFDPDLPEYLRYAGPFRLDDPLPGAPVTVGRALLSPTRTYAPLLVELLREHRRAISALVHCTGGGQTKCLRVGRGIHFVKDNLFPPPPLFQTIHRVTNTPWREMYQVFNMGHRMEIIGEPGLLPVVERLGKALNLEVRAVGRCEAAGDTARNRLTLHTPGGVERYPEP
jgi:phosphoribosylformylglycinamidine cyclo-ligase